MKPDFLKFATILEGYVYNIPDYQRPYSWGKKQRDDLFNDIKEIGRFEDRKHFMSTIVCLKRNTTMIRTDEFVQLDVVDGQQRLTTLILLLKAIEKKFEEKGKEEFQNEIEQIKQTLVKADRRLILIQTNHSNKEILRSYLVEGSIPSKDKIQLAADNNMLEAIKECEDFINKGDPEMIYKIMKNQLEFVFFILENEATVYTIFEVLNSRGMDVDLLDKLKSVMMV
jgi:uncharacterized protein with ParB-like and HNH nuclease domain